MSPPSPALSRALVTQPTDLHTLAPDIQESPQNTAIKVGRHVPFAERDLRGIVCTLLGARSGCRDRSCRLDPTKGGVTADRFCSMVSTVFLFHTETELAPACSRIAEEHRGRR